MKYLLFINIFIIATNCGVSKKSVASSGIAHCIINPIKVDSTINFNIKFTYNGNYTNGKLMIKKQNEETCKATIYSENGITLFNIEIDNNYAKISYAYETLNNKYIKSSLEEDMKLIFSPSTLFKGNDNKYYVIYKKKYFDVSFFNNTECTPLHSLKHKDKTITFNNSPNETIIKANIYTISLSK